MLYVNSSLRASLVFAFALISAGSFASAGLALHMPLPITTAPLMVPTPHTIKSYREWKSSMIGEAELRVKTLKDSFIKTRMAASQADPNLGVKTPTEAGLNANLQNLQNSIDKEELQLSLAQDLTISDYFVGYLTKQKSLKSAITEVSGRLSAEEVAELMTAYANNFFSSQPPPLIQPPHADSGF